jgi:signal transduction histidine kinase
MPPVEDATAGTLVPSAQNKAQAEQRDYGELLENLARLVPGVIYQYRLYPDGKSAFPWSSPGMNMIYEVTPEEVRDDATPAFGRLHPEDYDRVAEAIFESARTLQTFYCEFRVVLPRQGLRWRSSHAQPERMADGGTLWHGIIIDVTERVQAEAQNLKLQEQLQQAMKMEAVGRLAGGIAHDFNNLLTAIIGNTELTNTELASKDTVLEALTEIRKAADSAAALTRQLLAFSRKQLIEPRVLDANELVTSLQKMLTRLIGEDIELKTSLGRMPCVAKIDPGQFEQILVNLAVNARDAMPFGGTMTIETAEVELDAAYCARHEPSQPGHYVMIAVSDTGHGMPDEVRAHLFEPFFTTKDQGKGTGLGLATIFGAVKQAGGSIDVYSERGHGTTFKIYLPRAENSTLASNASTREPDVPCGNETILLVEDQEVVRRLAFKILKRLGYKVLQADNGATALHLVENHPHTIHVLLTDVVMPGMSGPELAERSRALRPDMQVLYTSGYTENAISHHGVLDSGVNFIAKPYVPATLAQKLRLLLDSQGVKGG